MKLFYWFRVHYKLIKRKFKLIDSFCRCCGKDVHDFVVEDNIWNRIESHIKHGNTLCYDCFCEYCKKVGLPVVWKLIKL